MVPIAPPHSTGVGISISSSAKVEPALFDDPHGQPGVILTTFEGFEAIVRRLKAELLKGTIVPTSSEDEPLG